MEVVARQRLEPKEAKRDDFAAQEVMPSNGKRGIFFVGRREALGRMCTEEGSSPSPDSLAERS